jgi:TPM domain
MQLTISCIFTGMQTRDGCDAHQVFACTAATSSLPGHSCACACCTVLLCLQVLGEPKPTTSYLIDDAGVINKTTKKAVNDRLKRLEIESGYRIEAVTVRKLEVEPDAFAFTDRLIESWCAPSSSVIIPACMFEGCCTDVHTASTTSPSTQLD